METKHISPSQATLYTNCPLQWKFRYIDKIEPKDAIIYPATIFGTAFHAVMEWMYEVYKYKPELAILAEGQEIFKEKFIDECCKYIDAKVKIVTREKLDDEIEKSRKMFYNAFKTFLKEKFLFEYDNIQSETEFLQEFTGVSLVGKVDFIGELNGNIDIIDFKTTSYWYNREPETDWQYLFYVYLFYKKFDKIPNSFIYLIYDRKKDKYIRQTIEVKPSHLKLFMSQFKELYEGMYVNRVYPKLDERQHDKQCYWCSFKKECREY